MAGLDVSVRITKNNFPAVIAAVESGRDELAKDVAHVAEDYAKGNVPVLHGFLRASIHTSGGGGNYVVSAESMEGGAPRQYAHYVEYGTSKMGAQPYMTPAAVAAETTGIPTASEAFMARVIAAAGG